MGFGHHTGMHTQSGHLADTVIKRLIADRQGLQGEYLHPAWGPTQKFFKFPLHITRQFACLVSSTRLNWSFSLISNADIYYGLRAVACFSCKHSEYNADFLSEMELVVWFFKPDLALPYEVKRRFAVPRLSIPVESSPVEGM